ncbi:carbohydrate ABC transporter permease (plasmid) [Enterococcus avium]|uniref:carbohydrate ABC transporter permease n=1 Tax=Enterococcus TaxID=1350 RepID=UPI000F4F62DD|nr:MULTISPECIES: carbohydrate ABC transporter permease [Enterococcus]ROY84883.1 carbohydrate ABC transporter permease [Enterococcus gallinarum]
MIKKKTWLTYLMLIIFSLICILPMVYMLSTTFKPNGSLYQFPPQFFPNWKEFTLDNYNYVLQNSVFYRNFLNSFIVAILSVSISSIVASALAFVLARFEFFGKKILFSLIIGTMMIPGLTLIIPQYELAVKLNMINKLFGLIPFYVAWVIPYSTFMIKVYIEKIPKEFDEAVYMDGGNLFTVFYRVILPLSKPVIATVSIFNFLTCWEEFPWANTVINDEVKRTIPIAISGFFGQHQFTQWGYVFALSALSLLPILAIYIFGQKYFVEDINEGGVK